MPKQNCWEVKGCGRESGGQMSLELGVCPAAAEARTSGLNGGINGGRVCWMIAGTLCGGEVQGSFAAKLTNCQLCHFYNQVRREEGENLASPQEALAALG
jgi:hypothetical protein